MGKSKIRLTQMKCVGVKGGAGGNACVHEGRMLQRHSGLQKNNTPYLSTAQP